MKKRVLCIIILICVISIIIVVSYYYFKKSRHTYDNYTNSNQDDTSEDLDEVAYKTLYSSDNIVQVISVAGKSREIDSIELNTKFNESIYIRKRVFYAIDLFTHSEYTDPFECYYDTKNKVTVSERTDEFKEYAVTFKFNNEQYIAVNSYTGFNIAIMKL